MATPEHPALREKCRGTIKNQLHSMKHKRSSQIAFFSRLFESIGLSLRDARQIYRRKSGALESNPRGGIFVTTTILLLAAFQFTMESTPGDS